MIKKILVLVFFILAGVGVSWWLSHRESQIHYVTSPVTRGSITYLVQATGTINPVVNVNVGAQVSGKITRLYADFNSHVKKGQLLAQIDPTSYQAAVDQSKADLRTADASIAVAISTIQSAAASRSQAAHNVSTVEAQIVRDKATLANSEINNTRQSTLAEKNLIALSDADTARYTFEANRATVRSDESSLHESRDRLAAAKVQVQVAEGQLASARSTRDRAQAALEQNLANLGYTHINSPVDGTVVARNVDVGQTVVSSFQAPSLFIIAQDLRKMQIDTLVDEASVGKIKIGQKVRFNVAAFPTEDFIGRVSQVRVNPIIQQNVVNYDVVVEVNNRDLKLLPGMTAIVSLIVAEHQKILKIPTKALRFVPPGGKKGAQQPGKPQKGAHVWVLKNGTVARMGIKTGISDDSDTEVLSGLEEKDAVVTDAEQKTGKNVNLFSPQRF